MSEIYIKQFKLWSDHAEQIDSREFNDFFYERELWWCALGVNIGSEQDGTTETFERPVLVIKKIRKDLTLIAPLTTKILDLKYRIHTTCTGLHSQILLDQIRIISSKRLIRKMSHLDVKTFQKVLIMFMKLLLETLEIETPPKGGESRSPKAKVTKSIVDPV